MAVFYIYFLCWLIFIVISKQFKHICSNICHLSFGAIWCAIFNDCALSRNSVCCQTVLLFFLVKFSDLTFLVNRCLPLGKLMYIFFFGLGRLGWGLLDLHNAIIRVDFIYRLVYRFKVLVDFIGSPNHFIGLKVSVLLSGAAGVLLWLLQTADDMSTNEWRRQNYFISHRQVSIVNCRQFVAVLSIYHLIQVDSVLIFAQVQSQDQLLCSGFSAWHTDSASQMISDCYTVYLLLIPLCIKLCTNDCDMMPVHTLMVEGSAKNYVSCNFRRQSSANCERRTHF